MGTRRRPCNGYCGYDSGVVGGDGGPSLGRREGLLLRVVLREWTLEVVGRGDSRVVGMVGSPEVPLQ